MDKQKVLKQVIEQLEKNLEVLIQSAHDAKDAATHEDSKAENKYDTRGLEASYLAGAQAKRAGELRESINKLKKVELREYGEKDEIESMAIVTVENEDELQKKFFLVPIEGGAKIQHDGSTYFFVTPDSPMGQCLWNQAVGHEFEFTIKGETQTFEIINVI